MSNDEFEGLENLVPDRVPDWLQEMVKKSKGRNLDDYRNLTEYNKHTEVVKTDRFDRKHYKGMREVAPELHDLAMSRFEDDPTWVELIQDEYLGLYKARPKTNKPDDMKPTHKLNHATMSKAMGLRDWEQLRTYTELDQWGAAMAAVEFGLKLADLFDEMKELMDAQDNMNDVDQKIKELLNELQEIGPDGELDNAQDFLDQLEDALVEYGEAAGNLNQQIQQNQNEIRQAVRQASGEALDDAQGVMDMLESFGTDPGQLQRMPAEARLELARRIQRSRKLKEMADKIGRFVRLALGEQARKIVHGTDEVHDIVQGNDINRMLPSELVQLAHPKTRKLFYKRYVERELLEYELRGTDKVARGAIIALIDSSGSMSGSKDTWARSVAIALLNIAYKQGRNFHGIIFSSASEMMEFEFPKGQADPNQVMDFAEFSFHGGTDFMAPISRGVEILRKQYTDEGSQKGDLVLITDGISAVTDEWLDRFYNAKEELAFRMYGCLIGFQSPLIETLSDQVYNITELAQGTDVREMFGYV